MSKMYGPKSIVICRQGTNDPLLTIDLEKGTIHGPLENASEAGEAFVKYVRTKLVDPIPLLRAQRDEWKRSHDLAVEAWRAETEQHKAEVAKLRDELAEVTVIPKPPPRGYSRDHMDNWERNSYDCAPFVLQQMIDRMALEIETLREQVGSG